MKPMSTMKFKVEFLSAEQTPGLEASGRKLFLYIDFTFFTKKKKLKIKKTILLF